MELDKVSFNLVVRFSWRIPIPILNISLLIQDIGVAKPFWSFGVRLDIIQYTHISFDICK